MGDCICNPEVPNSKIGALHTNELNHRIGMSNMTIAELWNLLRHESKGKFFSVTFVRRTDSKNSNQKAGESRTMLCRTGMRSHKLGVISEVHRDEEDFRNGVLTVWSVDSYTSSRKSGIPHKVAAHMAWRRINVDGIQKCSLLKAEEVADVPDEISGSD